MMNSINDLNLEIWKPVSQIIGYEVSNFGRVRSLPRKVKNRSGYRTVNGQIIKQLPAFDGYLGVQLRNSCKKTCFLVHRLVAIHFIDNQKNLPIINHIDGDKKNNKIENLEWTDKSGNAYHAISMGRWNMKKRLCI